MKPMNLVDDFRKQFGEPTPGQRYSLNLIDASIVPERRFSVEVHDELEQMKQELFGGCMTLMKSYEIWLKGGGSLSGMMNYEDIRRINVLLHDRAQTTYSFSDADGDCVIVDISQIAAFAFRDTEPEKGIGFRENPNE